MFVSHIYRCDIRDLERIIYAYSPRIRHIRSPVSDFIFKRCGLCPEPAFLQSAVFIAVLSLYIYNMTCGRN